MQNHGVDLLALLSMRWMMIMGLEKELLLSEA
jgi:hypothetical protein